MNQLGYYKYNQVFYTGTDTQPDILEIFVKPEKNSKSFHSINNMPLQTWLGMVPVVSFFSGAIRMKESLGRIFKISKSYKSQNKKELWNAFTNLSRGMVEMIPFSWIPLMFYQAIKLHLFSSRILKQIKQSDGIAGVAKDGKIIFTIDLKKSNYFKRLPNSTTKEKLASLQYLCIEVLKREEEAKKKEGMTEIFLRLFEFIERPQTHVK